MTTYEPRCSQCDVDLNPTAYMLATRCGTQDAVCMACVRRNHALATGGTVPKRRASGRRTKGNAR